MSWILYHVPWWVWATLGLMVLGAVTYVWRAVGWRNLATAAVVLTSAVLLLRSRQSGYQDRVDEENDHSEELEKKYEEIDRDDRTVDDAYDRLRD